MMKEQLDSIEVKEELCRMLKELDEYLGRHEIQYSIMSGTMLGAVRHGGFIPWDDDVDIAILRKDYDRLIEILQKNKRISAKLEISGYEVDKTDMPFLKVYNKSIVVKDNLANDSSELWIDIFPFDRSYKMVDVEKCPYIEYKIQGLSGIIAKEEKIFCVKDDLIMQIELKQEGLEITGLKVQLKEDSIIDEQVKQTIRRKIERFLVNLYGNPNVYVSEFSMGILRIFNPNSKETQYEFSSTLVISTECSCAIQCNADYFKKMYEKQVPEDKADEVYPLLFSTMRIGDIFVRYLMQYEILLGQVTKKHTQKEVVEYIEKVYNPANKDRQIGFQPTRKLGRKYKEDDLTYNRNLLGHGDIEKVVSEEKIRQLSRSIMDVLWFSLWNKSE